MNKIAFTLTLILCILFGHETTCASSLAFLPCDFPAIYNFGDGNSDTGTYTAAFDESPPFYGQSYFNGTSGRASDGRIVLDFIASSLGKSFLHPYLDSLAADFSDGVNFANLLATIAPPKVLLPVGIWPRAWSPFYLDIQYNQFKEFVHRSQIIRKKGGVFKNLLPKNESFSKALYTIDIGQNDISMGILTHTPRDELINTILPATINRLMIHLKKLYNLGARTFWIHNTPPIGCLPFMLTVEPVTEDETDGIGCAIPHNELSQHFNVLLKKSVDQLRKDLPLAAITYVDIYTVRYSLFKDAEKYGFKLPLQTCCGLGGKYNWGEDTLCGNMAMVNGSQVLITPCENPRERIIWDGTAYSEAADSIVFNKIATGDFSEPRRPLKMACGKYDHHIMLPTEAMDQIELIETTEAPGTSDASRGTHNKPECKEGKIPKVECAQKPTKESSPTLLGPTEQLIPNGNSLEDLKTPLLGNDEAVGLYQRNKEENMDNRKSTPEAQSPTRSQRP